MSEQKINNIQIPCLEISDNKEQKKGGKFIYILCRPRGKEDFSYTGQVVLLPAGLTLTIRSVEKSGKGECVAVLKGIHRKELKRGNLLVPSEYAISSGKDAFFLLPSSEERFEKGTFFIEGGIFPEYNSRNNRPSVSMTFHGRVASARFFFNFPQVPGARYYISSEDNRDLRHPVTLVYPGALNQKDGALLAERLLKFGGRPSLKALYSIILRMNKAVNLPRYMENEEFEGSVRSGSWAIMSRDYDRMKSAILKRSAAFGGILEKELPVKISGDKPVVLQVISEQISAGNLVRREGYIINKTREAGSSLSPIASKLLADLESEAEGIRLSTISNPLFSETYRALGRLELAKVLQGEIILGTGRYNAIKEELLSTLEVGDELDLNKAKESLNLGRRLLIPLLEQMDSEGYFKWEEENRVVLKKE